MGLRQWVLDSKAYYRTEPFSVATRASIQEFWQGFFHRVSRPYNNSHPGTPIWEKDWNILCVLDGCRLDLMYEYLDGPTEIDVKEVDSLRSVGSMSPEWLGNTFNPKYAKKMEKTAYISGNPWTANEEAEHEHLPLSDEDFGYFEEAWRANWSDETGMDISTVPPEPLTDSAMAVLEEESPEYLIVHYMQPHEPFRSRPSWFSNSSKGIDLDRDLNGSKKSSIWHRNRNGEIDSQELWDAYKDNLEWVMEDIHRFANSINDDIVLTADHGNAMGEWGVYGHPSGSPISELRDVPWITIRGSGSEKYSCNQTKKRETVEADVQSRLESLGYKS